MSSRLREAVQRLERLAEDSDGNDGLAITAMIEAVVGPGYDTELLTLVEMALKNSGEGMSLDQIANGILALEDWRISQA
tara:strand:+ start:1288 stop:1524 length:237 start_codon:yes stop_codon:yes gene_type:complete